MDLTRYLDALRGLSGRTNARFAGYLVNALDVTIEGAVLVRRAVAGEVTRATAVEAMREIEHRGDDERAALVVALRPALVTPIDREDLFALSRAIDDVLDNLRDFLREWDLFEMERSPIIEPVVDAVVAALDETRSAVASMAREPGQITLRTLAAKKSGNAIRRVYEIQLAALLRGEVTADLLRQRELLRRLDVVGLRLGTAADILAEAAVKRAEG
jgi:uncharacterized protein Yka (UPF0111/DUF47 family)